MNTTEYISSGILELYVAGVLSERENAEIGNLAKQYPEIDLEIQEIETTILEFMEKSEDSVKQIPDFDAILKHINSNTSN